MGNCCGKKEKKVQNVKITQRSEETQKTQQQRESQIINPQLPKKKRVKETVKVIQSIDTDGNKVLNQYILTETLGVGSFGKVKKATKKDEENSEYAIKILKKSKLKRQREFFVDKDGRKQIKSGLDKLRKEIAIMKKLNHENVIKLYEVIEQEDGDKLYLVIDYAKGGQIIDWDDDEQAWVFTNDEYKDILTEEFLKQLFRDSVKGLEYLHAHNIMHRDIKPQNILLNEKLKAMMADFGVSSIVQAGDDTLNNTEGSYYFMAPEVLDKDKGSAGYSGQKADIWSLGISMFCFAYRQQPLFTENVYEFMDVVQKQEIKYPDSQYSSGFVNLLKQLLIKNPNERISLEDIGKNEWINQGYEQSLSEEMKVNKLEEASDEEIRNALQISTVVRIKSWVQKWKSERKLSQPSRDSSPPNLRKEQYYSKQLSGSQFLNPNLVTVSSNQKQSPEEEITKNE